MVDLRLIFAVLCLSLIAGSSDQSLSEEILPQPLVTLPVCNNGEASLDCAALLPEAPTPQSSPTAAPGSPAQTLPQAKTAPQTPVDKDGNPIPLERRQPQRILGFMPNFRTVSGGATAHPPGFKYNFVVATQQAFDYSSFIFLGLTSLSAEGLNEHPPLGKGIEGFSLYTWRGFVDKTDNTYLSAWFLPTLFREDTRYYALGAGHRIDVRALYVISQQAVARTYTGHLTPNIAGIGGKAITQYVSRYYYPPSAGTFEALAEKFGYSVMRDVAFSSVREFYPDIAAHYVRKHHEKEARLAAKRAAAHAPAPAGNAPQESHF